MQANVSYGHFVLRKIDIYYARSLFSYFFCLKINKIFLNNKF